jgi:hypothetical protein
MDTQSIVLLVLLVGLTIAYVMRRRKRLSREDHD